MLPESLQLALLLDFFDPPSSPPINIFIWKYDDEVILKVQIRLIGKLFPRSIENMIVKVKVD